MFKFGLSGEVMRIKVTRSSSEEQVYAVSGGHGMGTRPGVKAGELKNWLERLGLSGSAIATVLSIPPNESVTVEVADTGGEEDRWAKAG